VKSVEPGNSPLRKLIGQLSCPRVGSTSLYSLLLNLVMTGRVSAQTLRPDSRYKALVCLFLDGGNDSFNMLAPFEDDEFARYKIARGDLALKKEELLEISDASRSGGGRRFGVHPGMADVRKLYREGKLSFVCNVGTLVEPTDLNGVNNTTARLPLGLYSHADQVMHWQTCTPDIRGSNGWAGRAAEILGSVNESSAISMNISLSGTNIFQSGRNLIPYAITPNGVSLMDGYKDPSRPFFRKAVDSLLEQHHQNLLKQTYSNLTRNAIESADVFLKAWKESPVVTTAFPDTHVGRALRGVAQSIAARDNLQMKRQTYFVRSAGWDHHDEVMASQAVMLEQISQAVGAFWQSMGELGLQDDVLLFTASDFGRTISSNGKGSDHGWGGNQFILGGGHHGGRLVGDYPEDLSLGNCLDTGRGRLIPTTSVDELFCELALWLGVARADIPRVLPNIERFYDLRSNRLPLGLFS
jgi:uncharacterized protein (DUF1501 family)